MVIIMLGLIRLILNFIMSLDCPDLAAPYEVLLTRLTRQYRPDNIEKPIYVCSQLCSGLVTILVQYLRTYSNIMLNRWLIY